MNALVVLIAGATPYNEMMVRGSRLGLSSLTPAAFFVFLGIFFDFFDGFFARKLNVQSALGLQLDSLAEVDFASALNF